MTDNTSLLFFTEYKACSLVVKHNPNAECESISRSQSQPKKNIVPFFFLCNNNVVQSPRADNNHCSLLIPFPVAIWRVSVSLQSSVHVMMIHRWLFFMITTFIRLLFSCVKFLYFCAVPMVLTFLTLAGTESPHYYPFSQRFRKVQAKIWLAACSTFSALEAPGLPLGDRKVEHLYLCLHKSSP